MSSGISYELIEGGKRGLLTQHEVFTDSIKGYRVTYSGFGMYCNLYPHGELIIDKGSIWDFGSFAIDTPAMVIASLEHDAFCVMTNARVLPWSVRMQADKNFFERLSENGSTVSRWWRTPAVMIYSQVVARWKDRI